MKGKIMSSTYNNRLGIKLSSKEKEKLKKAAKTHGFNMSVFLRFLIDVYLSSDGFSTYIKNNKNWCKSVIKEITRYGNNLNQIALRLNIMKLKGYSSYSPKDLDQIINETKNLNKEIKTLAEALKKKLI